MEYHPSSSLLRQSSALDISLKILSLVTQIISIISESDKTSSSTPNPLKSLIIRNLTSRQNNIPEIQSYLSSLDRNSYKIPENLSPVNTLFIILIHFHPSSSKSIYTIYKFIELNCNKLCLLHNFFYTKEFNSLCDKCFCNDKGEFRPAFFNICLVAKVKNFITEDKLERLESVARRPQYFYCKDIIGYLESINDEFLRFLREMKEFYPGENCSRCTKQKRSNKRVVSNQHDFEVFIVYLEWRGAEVNQVEVLILMASICFSFGIDRIFEERCGIYELKAVVFLKSDEYYYLDVESIWNEPSLWQSLVQYIVLHRFCPVNLIYRKVEPYREGIKLDKKFILKMLKLAVQIKWFSLTAACNNMLR